MLCGAQTRAHVNESIRLKFKFTAYHVTGTHTHTTAKNAVESTRKHNDTLSQNDTAEVLPLVSKVAGVLRCWFWRLENVMLWRGIMGFVQFGDKRVSDPVLFSCTVEASPCGTARKLKLNPREQRPNVHQRL